jgi:hypothetical protein
MTTNVTPKTWTVGELVTAAMLNEQLRDNMNARWPYTTKGDIAVATGANDLARLAVGSDYKVLTALASETSGLKWQALGSILQVVQQTNGISTDTTSTSYTDVTNATITLTLTNTSKVLMLATASITAQGAEEEYIKGVIDGTDKVESINQVSASGKILQWNYLAMQTCSAGSRVVKLQFKSYGGTRVNLYNGALIAIVLPTA